MNQITLPIDKESLEIVSQFFDTQGNIVIEVKSTKDSTACHNSQKPATKRYGTNQTSNYFGYPSIFKNTPSSLTVR